MAGISSTGRWSGKRRLIAILAAGLMVMAACGDDADDEAGDTTGDEGSGTAGAPEEELECPGPEATGDPVKIGVAWPEGATISLPELGESATAAADYANDCLGGIGGRPIEVMGCTIDETDQSSASSCANGFVEDGVTATVVTITAQGATLVPIITGAGIPYVVSGGSSQQESLDQTGLVFSVSSGIGGVLGAMALEAQEQDMSKVAMLVTENAAAGVQGLSAIPFGNVGVEVEAIAVPPGTPDMTPQVQAALSSGAGATAVIGDATFCISALQALQSLDPDGTHWLITTCTDEPVVEAVGEPGLDGATVFGAGDPDSDEPEAVLYRAIMAKYAPDTPTQGFTGAGYLVMMSLVRGAAGVTGEVTPESLATALAATTDIPATTGYGLTWGCSTRPLKPLTVCAGELTVGTMDGTTPVDIETLDASAAFGG
ncbi:MAG TPA: ABC transporter substrate-binding protein [Acidimicrobiales bacterium]|nr:ABC transporter substrate-binding protein [Acidimicrobiales bacterium]